MYELAEHLKSERLQRGLTLDEMSRKANLSKYVLIAIEDGDFKKVGPPLLIRRFVSFYCSALGIDSRQILEKYAEEIDAIDVQSEGLERYSRMRYLFGKKRKWQPMASLVSIAILALMIYGGVHLYERHQSVGSLQFLRTEGYPQLEIPNDLSESAPSIGEAMEGVYSSKRTDDFLLEREGPSLDMPLETGVEEKQEGFGESEEKPVSSSEISQNDHPSLEAVDPPESALQGSDLPPAPSDDVDAPVQPVQDVSGLNRLSFHAVEKTWVQVNIDRVTTQSALMMPGDTLEWTAKESVQIVLGNARGVEIKWNGESVNYPGRAGTVQRFTLPDPDLISQE